MCQPRHGIICLGTISKAIGELSNGASLVDFAGGLGPANDRAGDQTDRYEVGTGDFAFAADHRLNAVSFVAGTLNSATVVSIAATPRSTS
jgi:hypothetical protein